MRYGAKVTSPWSDQAPALCVLTVDDIAVSPRSVVSLHVEPPHLGRVQFSYIHTQIHRIHLNIMWVLQSLSKQNQIRNDLSQINS